LIAAQQIDPPHAILFGGAGKVGFLHESVRRQQIADRRDRVAQTAWILLRGQHRHTQALGDSGSARRRGDDLIGLMDRRHQPLL
jgi:hypothetical protein